MKYLSRIDFITEGPSFTIKNQQENVAHLEQVVLAHLNCMAQQEFLVEWQHH